MANVTKLLHGSPDNDDLLAKLEPLPQEEAKLILARKDIRLAIRTAFAGLPYGVVVAPRFFTQGSHAYKTLNRRPLPLEMDMDDGAYLPMSFVQGAKPSFAASAFFEIIDKTLDALAKEKGWKHIKKDTCSRLTLDSSAHFDVPLYAIPDEEFQELRKLAEARAAIRLNHLTGVAMDSADDWGLLPSNKVLLAHRQENWVASDPRQIHKWFIDAIDLYGERLRRVCRYMKAWRDNHAAIHDVSSILLMSCAWETFEEMKLANIPERDDLTLLQVARDLPGRLADEILNPVDTNEVLSDKLDQKVRSKAIALAEELKRGLEETVHGCYNSHIAVDTMRQLWGDRIPNRPDLVGIPKQAATVLSHPPKIVPAPAVGRSTSG